MADNKILPLTSDSSLDTDSNSKVDSNTGVIPIAETTQAPLSSTPTHLTDSNQSNLMNNASMDHSSSEQGSQMMHTSADHSNDSGQQHTHAALLDLVPHSRATHVAVQNGSWFDPKTWEGGKVPENDAHVLIKEGVSVTYDQESDARLETIRVDGTLNFAHNVDTKLLVDTFVVAPSGELNVGTQGNPVQAGVKTQIIFTADGAINTNWDTTQLSRGLISHGKARIYGAEKREFLALQADVAAGDDSLLLKNAPQGWQVGDQIVLGGTNHRHSGSDSDNSRFQDEELTITRIQGNRIFFTNNDITSGDNTVLRFDHQRPDISEKNDLELYVANLTRNVSFETENANAVPTEQRAHVMFMHNPDVVVSNAGFYNLGRSNKNQVVDDPGTNVDGSPGKGTNPRGRYGLHIHRVGTTGGAAQLQGNAVVDTPGWGIVHHDSNAVLKDNVVFDVAGAGIVAESGNETGLWQNNLTIKTTGVDYDNIKRTKDRHEQLFDLGFKGEGYWVQGAAQIVMLDNTAISAADAGITLFGDTLHPEDDFRDKDTIPVDQLPAEIRALVAPNGQTEVDVTDIPLRQLSGFKSYNTRDGISLWAHKTNFDGQLELDSPEPKTAHNLISTIDDFQVWGIRAAGLRVQYSSHTDIKDGLIVGNNQDEPKGRGVFHNHASFNINYDRLKVIGFEEGLKLQFLNKDNDFSGSSIANSHFRNNLYNLSAIGGKSIVGGKLPDDFPAHFQVLNTTFDTPDNNATPVAQFKHEVVGGLALSFDAGGSYDSDPLKAEGEVLSKDIPSNGIAAYGWDFNNDGKIDKFGRQVSYHFSEAGSKNVTLQVWDNQGAVKTVTQTINVQPAEYRTPFINGDFSETTPFGKGFRANSSGANSGWLASNGTWQNANVRGGVAMLSNTNNHSSALAQVTYDSKIRKGKQTLGMRLKNTEGSGQINNDIGITLWGVNGQFFNNYWEKANPYQVGTLPMEKAKLADITLGGTSFDWEYFRWNVDLKEGYDYLLLQLNTRGTKDAGDFVGVDDVSIFGDGVTVPDASPIPKGDNRFYIVGSDADNSLVGSDRNQNLKGEEGNDTLQGRGGDDHLFGDKGNDKLRGNHGDDKLYGGDGDDFLGGGTGDDALNGGKGNDTLVGSTGNDNLYGDVGGDKLYGGNGNDTLNGSDGNDYLRGDQGDDALNGGKDNDVLVGQDGQDDLYGDVGDDRLFGGDDDDHLNGGAGDDELRGDNGNDSMFGDAGNDFLGGGNHNDTLVGGQGNDTLVGWNGNDTLYGGEDSDQLYGNGGNDNLNGQQGDDQMLGGNGVDTLNGGAGNDLLDGGQGDDSLAGQDGDDSLDGGAGADRVYGDNGNDLLRGGLGNDTLGGSAGNDSLEGNQDSDTLWGGDGFDTLVGGSGNDSLDGGAGDDRIIGVDLSSDQAGRGEKDALNDWGKSGADIFVLGDNRQVFYDDGQSNTAGTDDYAVIMGFDQAQGDHIQLHGQASNYRLGSAPSGLQSGTAIYLDTDTDELIAIVAYARNLDLSSSAFVYA